MKKLIAIFLIISIFALSTACKESSNPSDNDSSDENESIIPDENVIIEEDNQSDDEIVTENNTESISGFINNDYKDMHDLYGFVMTFLDYKEPAMLALEEKQSEFLDTVSGLAGGDWALDIPISPFEGLSDLAKSESSWSGEYMVYTYEIQKDGDVYIFKFTHTLLEEITEGTLDIKAGTLQLTVLKTGMVQKYQIKALGEGAYLRFWSEKAEVLEETRAHYTYFKGNDVAVGQEETTSPKELIGSNFNDDTYAENDEAWLKLIGGQASDFDGINS